MPSVVHESSRSSEIFGAGSSGGVYWVLPRRSEAQDSPCSTYVIQDYINGYGPAPDDIGAKPFNEMTLTSIRLLNQVQILASIQSRIDSVLSDVQGALLAELEDRELDAAQKLKPVNLRAAGTLAGVVLEIHLQRVAQTHGVVVKKNNPTIADLNDPLKQQSIYGLPVWRKNSCTWRMFEISVLTKRTWNPLKDRLPN